MTIEIIDDALAPMEMAAIEGHLMGQDILWNWNENIVAEEQRECEKKYDQQMTHLFYMNPTFLSPDYRCLEPLFYKLNASVMIRVKANLTFCTEKNILTGWHTDVIESWGKEIAIMLEEDAFFDGEKCDYMDSRQTKMILIR